MFRKLFSRVTRRLQRPVPTVTSRYATPGVYVEEVSSGVRAIETVDLSAAAFVGVAARGPLDGAVAITSSAGFDQTFGAAPGDRLGAAVDAFLANGGARAYVVRVDALPVDAAAAAAVLMRLDKLVDVGLLVLPGLTEPSVLAAAAGYCEDRRELLLVADAPRQADAATVGGHAAALGASSHAALYHPWLLPAGGGAAQPPSGAVAGLLADAERCGQIWKSAAGTGAQLAGFTAPDLAFSDADVAALTGQKVNAIRSLAGGGPVVWGARTLSDTPEYRYVGVRRFSSFVEASVTRGTEWAVFEPNGEPLWQSLRGSVADFLLAQWRAGALQGAKPEEAFFVRCDRTTMTQAELDAGRLVMLIGVAPVRPAEFVVLRVTQRTASAAT